MESSRISKLVENPVGRPVQDFMLYIRMQGTLLKYYNILLRAQNSPQAKIETPSPDMSKLFYNICSFSTLIASSILGVQAFFVFFPYIVV